MSPERREKAIQILKEEHHYSEDRIREWHIFMVAYKWQIVVLTSVITSAVTSSIALLLLKQ